MTLKSIIHSRILKKEHDSKCKHYSFNLTFKYLTRSFTLFKPQVFPHITLKSIIQSRILKKEFYSKIHTLLFKFNIHVFNHKFYIIQARRFLSCYSGIHYTWKNIKKRALFFKFKHYSLNLTFIYLTESFTSFKTQVFSHISLKSMTHSRIQKKSIIL